MSSGANKRSSASISAATSTSYRTSSSLSPEVESKMHVLTGGKGGVGIRPAMAGSGFDDDEETHAKPFLYVDKIDEILALEVAADRKLALIGEYASNAVKGHELYLLNRKLRKAETELQRERQLTSSGFVGTTNRRASHSKRSAPSVYIPFEDQSNHPLLRTSWIIKIALAMFAVMQVIEPVFVGTIAVTSVDRGGAMASSPPLQSVVNKLCPACPACPDVCAREPQDAARATILIVFFVLTLLMGLFVAYNFVEVREQELRLYFGEPEEMQPEVRQRELDIAIFVFAGVVFVKMVYALYATNHAVSTWHVMLVTFVCEMLLFGCFALLTRFEKKYALAER